MRLLHDSHADVTVYGDNGSAGMVGYKLGEVQAAVDDLDVRALFEIAGRIVPLAENLLFALADVLCDVVASGFVILIDIDTSGMTVLPITHIEDRAATTIQELRSGVWIDSRGDGHASEVAKAVEVNGSVLMQFRDKDIAKTLAPTGISQKSLRLFADHSRVVTVYQIRVERPSEEAGEAITKGDVPDSCFCSTAAYKLRTGGVIGLALRGYIVRPLSWLISRLAENGVIGHLQDVQGGV